MDLTTYNPNNDRGITTKEGVSGLRCFDGEDLCKLLILFSNTLHSDPEKNPVTETTTERLARVTVIDLEQTERTWAVR